MAKGKGQHRHSADGGHEGPSTGSTGSAQASAQASSSAGTEANGHDNGFHEADVSTLQRKLEEKEQEASESRDQMLRAIADLQNVRRRASQEADEARSYANQELVLRLLPILDNFELAIKHSETNRDFDGLIAGVQQILKQMRDTLLKEGVEPINAVGSPFDPEHHEAIGQIPTEEFDEGTVAEDLRRGYRMKGRLIRPSLVRVASR